MWRSEIARSAIMQKYQRYVWFVAWPLIVLAVIGGCSRSCSSGAGVGGGDLAGQVAAYGSNAVLTYLTAGAGDRDRLAGIYGDDLIKAPEGQQGIPLPGKTVLSSTATAKPAGGDDHSLWEVSVNAVTPDGFEVWSTMVRASNGPRFRVLKLPGHQADPPAGPPIAPATVTAIDVKSDTPLASTLRDFFDAWLCGKGDLRRVADVSTVQPFAAAPYSKVQVISAAADGQLPDEAEGALNVEVIVWGTKTSTEENSYTLTLTAQAGRWVVTNTAAPPLVKGAANGTS
jgi:hypothetical protein